MRIDYPGIGGSLGECVICGKSFALEVMLGRSIETVRMEDFSQKLPLHSACADICAAISKQHEGEPDSWQYLPEGPLRQEFARAVKEAEVRRG